jgi:hypothetical protein
MKVEWKFLTFLRKNKNGMEIWKWNFAERKQKRNFLDGSGNGNGTMYFGGTDVEMEFPFPTKVEFPLYRCSAWPI